MFRRLGELFWQSIDAIGEFRRRLTDPIERLFGYLFSSTLSTVDATGSRDSIVGRFFGAIAYPFVKIASGLVIALRWMSNHPIFGYIYRFFSIIAKPITIPAAAMIAFLGAFYHTRSRRLFWLVLPLTVVTVVCVGVIFQVRVREKTSVERRYRSALGDAIESQDFAAAALYREKLRQLESATDRIELQQASRLLEQGSIDQAYAIVESLVAGEGSGSAGAHFWLAVNLLEAERAPSRKTSLSREQAALLAITHLEKAAEIVGKDSQEVVLLRAIGLLNLGKVQEADSILLPLRDSNFSIALLRLKIDQQTNNQAELLNDARAVVAHAEKDLKLLANANESVLSSVFSAESLLQRWPQAEEVVDIWLVKNPKDQNAINSLIYARTNRFEREWTSASSVDFQGLADLAISIANLTSGSGRLAITPLLFSIDSENNVRSREFIELIKSRSNLPGEILAFLGTSAAAKDQYETARDYLSKAIEADPNLQTAWNNYAYVLDKGFPDEIAQAKMSADKAVLLDPKDVHARDTRADILIRAQDWNAAIIDLKILTNKSYSPKSVHARLAACYKAIGNKKLEKIHERLAE